MLTSISTIFGYMVWVVAFLSVVHGLHRTSQTFAYTQIHSILFDQGKWGYRMFHRFNSALAFVYAARFTLITLALRADQAQMLSTFDGFTHFARHFQGDNGGHSGSDPYFLVIFISLALFAGVLEPKLYFSRPDTFTWGMHLNIVVRNMEAFQRATVPSTSSDRNATATNSQQLLVTDHYLVKYFGRRLFAFPRAKTRARHEAITSSSTSTTKARRMSSRLAVVIDLTSYSQTGFTEFAGMSPAQWLSLVPLIQMMDLVSRVTLVGIYTAMWCFVSYYVAMFHGAFPSAFLPWVLLDLTLFTHLIVRVVVVSLLLFCCSVNGSRTYRTYIGTWNRTFIQAVARIRAKKWVTSFPVWFENLLAGYVRSHAHLSVIMLFTNAELWGTAILFSLGFQLPGNIYLVYRICTDGSQSGVIWLILSAQIGIILGSLTPMVGIYRLMHGPGKAMISVQLALSKFVESNLAYTRVVRYKVKYMTLYERLTAKRYRYGVTIGPSKAITSKTIFQLFLLYIVYVLGAIQFFLGQRKQTKS